MSVSRVREKRMHGLTGGGWKRSPHGPPRQSPTLLRNPIDPPANTNQQVSGLSPQPNGRGGTTQERAAGLRLPSHALGSASALAGRLVAAAVNLSGELRMCHDGHHRDNEQPVLSSEGCEAGTSHTGVSFPTSSLCF
jgi:hypothetical protein